MTIRPQVQECSLPAQEKPVNPMHITTRILTGLYYKLEENISRNTFVIRIVGQEIYITPLIKMFIISFEAMNEPIPSSLYTHSK